MLLIRLYVFFYINNIYLYDFNNKKAKIEFTCQINRIMLLHNRQVWVHAIYIVVILIKYRINKQLRKP